MYKLIVPVVAIGGWLAYVHGQSVQTLDVPKNEKTVIVSHHVKTSNVQQHPVLAMSDKQFQTFVASQNPHDPVKVEIDTTVHWPMDFQHSLLPYATSSSAESSILSGDANFTGATSDTGSTEVTNTTVAPSGYHLVRGYTTTSGKYVKPHLVKDRTASNGYNSPTGATNSTNYSTPIFTHQHDTQQRTQISQENFPGQTFSNSDPTVIIGTP